MLKFPKIWSKNERKRERKKEKKFKLFLLLLLVYIYCCAHNLSIFFVQVQKNSCVNGQRQLSLGMCIRLAISLKTHQMKELYGFANSANCKMAIPVIILMV